MKKRKSASFRSVANRKKKDSVVDGRTQKYVFVNPLGEVRATTGRVFVYFLAIPCGDGRFVPFYVSSSQQLRKRLGNHAAVNWFNQKFGVPVPVFIVGTVPVDSFVEATQDLVALFVSNNVFGDSSGLLKANVECNVLGKLMYSSVADIVSSLSGGTRFNDSVLLWQNKWGVKTFSPEPSLIAVERLGLLQIFLGQLMYRNGLCEQISGMLAESFVPSTGVSAPTKELSVLVSSVGVEKFVRHLGWLNKVWLPYMGEFDGVVSFPEKFVLSPRVVEQFESWRKHNKLNFEVTPNVIGNTSFGGEVAVKDLRVSTEQFLRFMGKQKFGCTKSRALMLLIASGFDSKVNGCVFVPLAGDVNQIRSGRVEKFNKIFLQSGRLVAGEEVVFKVRKNILEAIVKGQ